MLTSMDRHMSPRKGQVILISAYLFWQLSIDYNIDVQYVCNISFPALPNYLKNARLNIGFPVVQKDARAVYGYMITKFSGMSRFT